MAHNLEAIFKNQYQSLFNIYLLINLSRGDIIMSKQLVEQTPHHNEEMNTVIRLKKDHYKTLEQSKAISYLARELNKLFVQREQPIEKAFAHFLNLLSTYSGILPENLEANLSKIFSETLQDHQPYRLGIIDVLFRALNETDLTNYLHIILQEEVKLLNVKSSFRVAMEHFYHRWNIALRHTLKILYCDYDKVALHERCQHLDQIKSAIDSYNLLKAKQSSNQTTLYPDDELVSTVLSILDHGKKHQYSHRLYIGKVVTTNVFNEFIDELKGLNNERLSKKLIAHDCTLTGQNFDVFTVIQELLAENNERPYAHEIAKILKALVVQNTKNIVKLTSENAALNEEADALTLELEEADLENKQLKRQIALLEQEVASLKSQLKNSSLSETQTQLPALHDGPFSVSFG